MGRLRWLPLAGGAGGALVGLAAGYGFYWWWDASVPGSRSLAALANMVWFPTFGVIGGTAIGFTIGEVVVRCREQE